MVAAAVGPEVRSACGDPPGTACRWVFDRTGSEGWAKLADFLVTRPLKVLAIVLVAYLANRLVRRLIGRFAERLAGSARQGRLRQSRERSSALVVPGADRAHRAAARAETIGVVLTSAASAAIWTFTVLYVVSALGLELGPLLAGAGIAGVAIGFGAQSVVRDLLAGLFILAEDQYGVGDVVDLGEAAGGVEAVTLRTTRLRDVNGTVWYVPNGEIRRVGNKSQQWARAVLDLSVAYGTDLEMALNLLKEVAEEVAADPVLSEDLLEEPEVWGVEQVGPEGVMLRLVVKTRPGAQFELTRVLRGRAMDAFVAAGIAVPVAQRTIVMGPGEGAPVDPLEPPDRPAPPPG